MLLMAENRRIEFWEGNMLIKTLSGEEDLRAAYRLRHQVFADRLRWVGRSPEEFEVDAYDTFATSVGIFDGDHHLVGVFRMINSEFPFMLESEFRACLLPHCRIRKASDTAEITRLAIDPAQIDKGLSTRLMQVLFKAVYQWSIHNDIRYLYMVVEKRFLRGLRGMGFPCEAVSPAVALPPAEALSIAAVLDWGQFHDTCSVKQPGYYRWMNSADGSEAFERSEFVAKDPKAGSGGLTGRQELADGQRKRQREQPLVAA